MTPNPQIVLSPALLRARARLNPKKGRGLLIGAAIVALFFTPIGATFVGAMATLKSSETYGEALDRVTSDPWVKKELGTPITASLLVTGKLEDSDSAEVVAEDRAPQTRLSFKIEGSERQGEVFAVANWVAGRWEFAALRVMVPAERKWFDLLKQVEHY